MSAAPGVGGAQEQLDTITTARASKTARLLLCFLCAGGLRGIAPMEMKHMTQEQPFFMVFKFRRHESSRHKSCQLLTLHCIEPHETHKIPNTAVRFVHRDRFGA